MLQGTDISKKQITARVNVPYRHIDEGYMQHQSFSLTASKDWTATKFLRHRWRPRCMCSRQLWKGSTGLTAYCGRPGPEGQRISALAAMICLYQDIGKQRWSAILHWRLRTRHFFKPKRIASIWQRHYTAWPVQFMNCKALTFVYTHSLSIQVPILHKLRSTGGQRRQASLGN